MGPISSQSWSFRGVSASISLEALSDGERIATLTPGTNRSVFLTCEHASNRVPHWFAPVLPAEQRVLNDHWGWDIGAMGLSRVIARSQGYSLIGSELSRLVCDLNRSLEANDLFREQCDDVMISFNLRLDEVEKTKRHQIHETFHRFTGESMQALEPESLISIHSFTPIWQGVAREIEIGILFNRYQDSAERLRERLRQRGVRVALNEPYSGFQDGVYSIERHGLALDRPYLEIEVRQDLIQTQEGQLHWGMLLGEVIASDIFSAP